MDFSKQPLYSVDYFSGVMMAIALTMMFYSAIRDQNSPAKIWFVAMGSWIAGFAIMFLGAIAIRWLPIAIAALSLIIIIFAVIRAATSNRTSPPRWIGAVVAAYFCVTVLVLCGTILARSYFSSMS